MGKKKLGRSLVLTTSMAMAIAMMSGLVPANLMATQGAVALAAEETGVSAVNAASSYDEMRTALESADLAVDRTEYNGLTAEQKNTVAQVFLENRLRLANGAYLNLAVIQQTLNETVFVAKSGNDYLINDYPNVQVEYPFGGDASHVTEDVYLPSIGAYGTPVEWSSSDESVIGFNWRQSEMGVVTRPAYGTGNATVRLTASLNGWMTKVFDVTVLESTPPPTPLQTVNATSHYATMRNAIQATELGLNLTEYNKLSYPYNTDAYRNMVGDLVLSIRPAEGYADTTAVQAALDQAIVEVNQRRVDFENIQIGFAEGDSVNAVTQNLTFPTQTTNSKPIEWSSTVYGGATNTVISAAGVVTRPSTLSGDTTVTISQRVYYGSLYLYSYTPVKVKALPQHPEVGVALGVVNSAVTVETLRDALLDSRLGLTLTEYNKFSTQARLDTVSYLLNNRPASGFEKAADLQTALDRALQYTGTYNQITMDLGYYNTPNRVVQNFWLEMTTSYPTTKWIKWTSSRPDVLNIPSYSVTVKRPAYEAGDAKVTVTGTVDLGWTTVTRSFEVNVARIGDTDKEAVDLAYPLVKPTFAPGDTTGSITKDITLPTADAYGTKVTWYSNQPGIISTDGKVTRPQPEQGDTYVSFYATIERGSVKQTRYSGGIVKALQYTPMSEQWVKVLNNKRGTEDTVTVNNVQPGDVLKVYAEDKTTVLGETTASETTATISIPELGANYGTIYVSNTRVGYAEQKVAKIFPADDGMYYVLQNAALTYDAELLKASVNVEQAMGMDALEGTKYVVFELFKHKKSVSVQVVEFTGQSQSDLSATFDVKDKDYYWVEMRVVDSLDTTVGKDLANQVTLMN